MKTPEEIAISHGLYHSFSKKADDMVISAMKEYAQQIILEVIEICDAHADSGSFDKDGALANSLNILSGKEK